MPGNPPKGAPVRERSSKKRPGQDIGPRVDGLAGHLFRGHVASVPITMPVLVMLDERAGAIPKSRILIDTLRSIAMFAGLMSRCTMLRGAYRRPAHSSSINWSLRPSVARPAIDQSVSVSLDTIAMKGWPVESSDVEAQMMLT
jgi:hypothetical protein